MKITEITINPNKRRDPFIQDTAWLSQATIRRGVDLAIPFINLYQPAAVIMSVGLGVTNSVVELREGYLAFRRGEWSRCAQKAAMTTFLVSSIALTVFMPVLGIIATQSFSIISHISNIGVSLYRNQYGEVSKSLLETGSSVIYIGSTVYATPELLLISLTLQAGAEFSKSYREFSRGRYLETVANILLATIRVYGAKDKFFTVKRNWLGKKLDQQKWDEMVAKAAQDKRPFDVEKFLIEENISSYIKKIEAKEAVLREAVLKNLYFKECNFEQANFDRARFEKVSFDSCLFEKARFIHAVFSNTTFECCLLKEVSFYQSFSKDLKIFNSNLEGAAFNNSKHERLFLDRVLLEETCFLHSQIKDSVIKNSQLTNCILADAKNQFKYEKCSEHRMTRPVVALTWTFENSLHYASEIKKILKKQGAIVMHFEFSPEDINAELLEKEVNAKFLNLQQGQGKDFLSRADYVISNPQKESQMAALCQKIEAVTNASNAVILSGGDDVESSFYGKEMVGSSVDYRRSIMEFMLIKQNLETKRPMLGTCRGAQITNVYFGGSLKDVGWQGDIKQFEYVGSNDKIKEFQDLLQSEDLFGFSAHYQAMDRIGKGLEVIARDGEIPKLVVGDVNHKHILLTQFHPEFYLDMEEMDKRIDIQVEKISRELETRKLGIFLGEVAKAKEGLRKIIIHKKFYEHFLAKVDISKQIQPIA